MTEHKVHCSAVPLAINVGEYGYTAGCTCLWYSGKMVRSPQTVIQAIAAHTEERLDLSCDCTRDIPGLREELANRT